MAEAPTNNTLAALGPPPSGATAPAAPPTPSTTDDSVSTAFALAWHVAEMFHGAIPTKPELLEVESSLPAISELKSFQLFQMGLMQLRAGAEKLGVDDGLVGTALTTLAEDLKGQSIDPDQIRQDLLQTHASLLVELNARNFRLGKAYGLGRALAECFLLPCAAARGDRKSALVDQFKPTRLASVYRWLAELKTNLPDHSAYAVSRSLSEWEQYVMQSAPADDQHVDLAISTLKGQAQMWRTLLTNEKQATDLLRARDFVDAAGYLFGRLQSLARQYVTQSWKFLLSALLFIAVIVAAITIVAAVVGQLNAVWASVVAAIVGLAGLWQSISKSVGETVGKLRQPLWDSELDESIAQAAMHLPEDAPSRRRLPAAEVGEMPQGYDLVDQDGAIEPVATSRDRRR